jgi:hypothetical protein
VTTSDDTRAEVPTFAEPPPAQPPARPRRRGLLVPKWLAIVVALLIIGGLGFAIGWVATPDDSSSASSAASQGTTPSQGNTPGPTTTTPPASSDPSASALRDLGVRQSDLSSAVSVGVIPRGTSVTNASTLDLCNATYPSESERKARLQLAAVDQQDNVALSTESVLYANAAATEQAFTELDKAAAACPSTPVASPVGEATTTTKFNAAPDGAWPQVAGVERRAFDFTSTDDTGQSQRSVAVYLRRGRALMGIYFPQPDSPQTSVSGQTTIPGIVNVFAQRLADLPDSVVN